MAEEQAPDATSPTRHRLARVALWLGVGLIALGALLGAVVYTEQPSFCRVCHEMTPYYDAWASGAHGDVSCITCHVAPGLLNRAAHKFVALKEVWDHFTTEPLFPMLNAEVPNDRCTSCHPEIPTQGGDPFSHQFHVGQPMTCQQCHADAGHRVTFDALEAAGILAPGTRVPDAAYVGENALGSQTGTTLPGHPDVKCSGCHDMAAAGCETCHDAPRDHFVGKCSVCHAPGASFDEAVFDHPRVGEEHSAQSFPCAYCHPNGLETSTCVRCHEGGAPEEDD